jgi:hypothetical protein
VQLLTKSNPNSTQKPNIQETQMTQDFLPQLSQPEKVNYHFNENKDTTHDYDHYHHYQNATLTQVDLKKSNRTFHHTNNQYTPQE